MSGIPKGYKKTEVGVIPEDWDVKRLGDLTTSTTGGTPSTNVLEYWGGSIPWMSSGDLHLKQIYNVNGRITQIGLENSSAHIIPKNCVLIGLAGQGKTRGTAAINRIPLCTNQSIGAILPKNTFSSDYLFYVIDSMYEHLRSLSSGDGGRGGLNLNILNHIVVSLPNFTEQKAIAEVLSDMDALIEAQKELIAKKRAIKQGTMQDLLSGRVRLPGYETKGWKHTDIGDVPDDWDVKKLGEEGVFLTTSSYTRSELREYGDVACLHYGDIHTRFDTWLDCSSTELPMISRDMVKQYPYLKNGDLVIADASEDYEGLGDCVEICNIDSRLCIGGLHTIVYRAKPGLFAPSYIGLLRNLQLVRNQLVSQAVGTKVYSLTNSMIGSILVPVPSLLSEQQAIAEVLSDMDDELETLEAELKKLNHMKRGMMQELLTGRIRLI